jgi:hypothetical protein
VDASIAVPVRSPADRVARRILALPPDAPRVSLVDAQNAFHRSIFISASRCLLTYVLLPVLRPLLDLTRGVGPAVGIVLSAVSMVAIIFAARRFFAADHPWRWKYTVLGGGVFIFVVMQAVLDIAALVD